MALSTAQLVGDLRMFGCELVYHSETCRCVGCHQLDLRSDIDAIATAPNGITCFVAWRDQTKGKHDFPTITVRLSSDRGSSDVQGLKLVDGRSRADVYVQSYKSGVAWAPASDIRKALTTRRQCNRHSQTLTGSDGQTFAVLCNECCEAVRYIPRDGTATPRARGQNADGTWGELGWYTEALYREWG
jgi:hypothetical protein